MEKRFINVRGARDGSLVLKINIVLLAAVAAAAALLSVTLATGSASAHSLDNRYLDTVFNVVAVDSVDKCVTSDAFSGCTRNELRWRDETSYTSNTADSYTNFVNYGTWTWDWYQDVDLVGSDSSRDYYGDYQAVTSAGDTLVFADYQGDVASAYYARYEAPVSLDPTLVVTGNEHRILFSRYWMDQFSSYYKNAVAVHEVGHSLGQCHHNGNDNCMAPNEQALMNTCFWDETIMYYNPVRAAYYGEKNYQYLHDEEHYNYLWGNGSSSWTDCTQYPYAADGKYIPTGRYYEPPPLG